MVKHDYDVIKAYELGLAPWTPEIEKAYMEMCASFVFGKDSLDSVPEGWWEEHRKEWMG